jgi:UPF0042 nucleotide-binding protein
VSPEVATSAVGRVVVVTGMSGAGRSTALKALEDQGFEAVDNLPLDLLDRLLAAGGPAVRDLAVGVDTRTRAFSPAILLELLRRGATAGQAATLVFIDCDDEVLQRRFTETRRRHPLAVDRPLGDGIARERQLLAPLRLAADLCLDTSLLSAAELRRLLAERVAPRADRRLAVTIVSFAYRRGLPREADLVLDVRFLANPHYDTQLRPLTGLDAAVQAHIRADPSFADFLARLESLIVPLLPRYNAEGKSYLTIAIGCTGGRHRSVFVAESLGARLADAGWHVGVVHRELAATGSGA